MGSSVAYISTLLLFFWTLILFKWNHPIFINSFIVYIRPEDGLGHHQAFQAWFSGCKPRPPSVSRLVGLYLPFSIVGFVEVSWWSFGVLCLIHVIIGMLNVEVGEEATERLQSEYPSS